MTEDLINRITYHLSSGGLFNPELADHIAVRTLLFECREALAQPETNLNCKSTQARLATAWGFVKAQPEQEPVAKVVSTAPERIWLDLGFDPSDEDEISFDDLIDATWSHDNATGYGIEYVRADTTPSQRTWVGLMDDDDIDWDGGDIKSFVRAIEAKLKEKNT